MHALTLLMDDHQKLKKMLKDGDETTERAVKTRTELLERLTAELKAHERIEEEILYPVLKEHAEAKEIVLEGYQEHHVADLLIAELHKMDLQDERWGAKWSVLKENIEHHIEEEEDDMFKKARNLLGRSELESLGDQMAELKKETLKKNAA
jgi:hemerythrin-like domain-containing protein